jgi:hypothetical protein
VRLAGFGVEPLEDAAVADDDAADHRVGAGVAGRHARQFHAPPHVVPVLLSMSLAWVWYRTQVARPRPL